MKTGAELITEERLRQIEKEGWTPEHDDEHVDGELALAGTCYAIDVVYKLESFNIYTNLRSVLKTFPKGAWPWDMKWWKPTPDDPIRQLTKAGALIAAEIDRLQRMKSKNDDK